MRKHRIPKYRLSVLPYTKNSILHRIPFDGSVPGGPNDVLPTYHLALANTIRPTAKVWTDLLEQALGAKPMGEGSYGLVYLVNINNTRKITLLRNMRDQLMYKILTPHLPAVGQEVAIKRAYRNTRRHLSEPAFLHFLGSHADTAPYVPRFYFSGYDMRNGEIVTVMAKSPGTTLLRLLRTRDLTARTYALIERAIASIWTRGVVHADFHESNVMIEPKSGTVNIIDFGMAVILPNDLHARIVEKVRRAIDTDIRSLGEVWDGELQAFVNSVHVSRRRPEYYPDGKALKYLHNMLTNEEAAKVPHWRRLLWKNRSPVSSFPINTNNSNMSSNNNRNTRSTQRSSRTPRSSATVYYPARSRLTPEPVPKPVRRTRRNKRAGIKGWVTFSRGAS